MRDKPDAAVLVSCRHARRTGAGASSMRLSPFYINAGQGIRILHSSGTSWWLRAIQERHGWSVGTSKARAAFKDVDS